LSTSTEDPFDLEQLRGWLSYCDHHHTGLCHHIDPNSFFQFPDEIILIDLASNNLSVCAQKERYAALSYVWGKSNDVFATLSSNFSDLLQTGGLTKHLDKLPATVKDAMSLCRTLDIPYLWCDRMCIVQDDEVSKQHNISWMASIYANSHLAIIAAQGPDANHGIRETRNTSRPREGYLTVGFDGIQCGHQVDVGVPNTWETRGWTFQERILARRSLGFEGRSVHWECERLRMDENISLQSLDTQNRVQFPYLFDLKLWPDFERYFSFCHSFSLRQLTFEKDVMDAFRSVTDALSQSFPGGFLYAMPEFLFSHSLVWHHWNPSQENVRRRKWLPSWSWMGWDSFTAWV
jgi:hypothetical protein